MSASAWWQWSDSWVVLTGGMPTFRWRQTNSGEPSRCRVPTRGTFHSSRIAQSKVADSCTADGDMT